MFGYYILNQICYLHIAFTELIHKQPFSALKLCIPLHMKKIKPCSMKSLAIQPLMKDCHRRERYMPNIRLRNTCAYKYKTID